MSLNFKFSENNALLKEFNVNTSIKNYSEYRKSLKSLQGVVNEYLTTLVNAETATVEVLKHDEDDDFLSSDSEGEKSPKRTLTSSRASQKNKVQKH